MYQRVTVYLQPILILYFWAASKANYIVESKKNPHDNKSQGLFLCVFYIISY